MENGLRITGRGVCFAALTMVLMGVTVPARGEAIGKISLPPGFRAELVYAVPSNLQGSWVALTVDDKGRIIASDQNGGLYRVTPSAIGAAPETTRVEPISILVGMAQGLLFHEGKLYVMVNGRIGAFTSGLYRVSDSDGDDKFDRFEQLRVFNGEGEHGPHAIVLGPDKKSLYVCCGNFTGLPMYSRTLPAAVWGEDQLLPRLLDPNGHGVELKAPGAWIARLDLDGANLDLVSVGYRNMYDIAFNDDGELLTFDSDMEWDIGMPWYRPCRVDHVVPGSDYGWRTGNGMWPDYYPDTLPGAIDVGPASPTGLTFGKGTKFPEKYQKALFGGDWSYGNIYAFHLHPHGASYKGEVERFASAAPLGVTDMVVRPQDGALYFAVGGRKSDSALYRIVYDEKAAAAASPTAAPPTSPTAPADPADAPEAAAKSREVLHSLEALLAGQPKDAVTKLWPYLSNPDRFIRYTARAALEQQPFSLWRNKVLGEPNVDAKINGLVAFARTGTQSDQADFVRALTQINYDSLNRQQRLDLLRAAGLGVMRLTPTAPATKEQLIATFDKRLPTGDRQIDRELSHLLIALGAPNLQARLLALLDKAVTQEEAIDAAISLSAVRSGWTMDQRKKLLQWFDAASRTGGGNSYFGYLVSARNRFLETFSESERKALAELVDKPLAENASQTAAASRPFVKEWQLDDALPAVEQNQKPRDFEHGRQMFAAAGCYNCHRVAGEGSSVGPDLTGVGGRFGLKDLLKSIVEPNYEISDQYRQQVFVADGQVIVGRVTNINNNQVLVSTDMLNPKLTVAIDRSMIEDQHPADVSVMPSGLLNTLSADDIADLVAYLRSGGRRDHPLFSTPAAQP